MFRHHYLLVLYRLGERVGHDRRYADQDDAFLLGRAFEASLGGSARFNQLWYGTIAPMIMKQNELDEAVCWLHYPDWVWFELTGQRHPERPTILVS